AAMGWADWPARLQRLARGPLIGAREVWVDGGHNPSAARQVASFAKKQFAGRPLHLAFASLETKQPRAMLEPFVGIAEHVHCLPVADHACFAPVELAAIARSLGFTADAYDALEEAVASVPNGSPLLIFGSLYLAGTVLAANGQLPD
ncbi:MAG TPA: bifunctional folylpolyglutamate synthase/dihydrofolate synthase, partial [Sphingomicrobium sp.]|nr:bifunctional folylpolyglutamate synthase/dihydrofolate synthase [Sphingomicrobium sp.]